MDPVDTVTQSTSPASRPAVPGVPDEAELRPSLTRQYSPRTLDCYADRLVHYQEWAARNGIQPGVHAINDDNTELYVRDQIARWPRLDELPDLTAVPAGEEQHVPPDPVELADAEEAARKGEPLPPLKDRTYQRLRPSTIKQAVNALIYYGERANGRAPSDRVPKELIAEFDKLFKRKVPKSWTISHERRPSEYSARARSRRPGG